MITAVRVLSFRSTQYLNIDLLKRGEAMDRLSKVLATLVVTILFLGLSCHRDDDSSPGQNRRTVLQTGGGEVGQGETLAKNLVALSKTFTLTGKIDFSPKIDCTPGDKKRDCAGGMVLAIFDKPFNRNRPGNAISVREISDMKKGSKFEAKYLKMAAKLYLVAFLDDNDTAKPPRPSPDRGDPIFIYDKPLTAKAGKTLVRNITFTYRRP